MAARRTDVWLAARRRWLVAGVLAALALAVLAPQGGVAGARYSWYLPLSYIYFSAGRRGAGAACGATPRLLAVGCAHAALVAPALALLLLAGVAHSEVHFALVQGVVISSVGGGCGWLSLAVCGDAAAAPLAAACYLLSLLSTPLAMMLLCGRGAVPTGGAVAGACAPALGAWGAGAAAARAGAGAGGPRAEAAARACALALLYMECSSALALRGSVRPEDVLAVLVLEGGWLALSAAACWGYARCGLLAPAEARTLALCAVPKGAHVGAGWQAAACASSALAQLPAALLPPAQALLLAALAPHPAHAPHPPRPPHA